MSHRRIRGLLIAALICSTPISSLSLAADAGTKKPSIPPEVCVQTSAAVKCAKSAPPAIPAAPVIAPTPPVITAGSDTSGNAGKMKWTPGNYVRADAQGFRVDQPSRFAVYDRVRNEPLVKGGLMIVNWGIVEKSRGVYDFSLIDEELARLKSMNKKLIIEIWWGKFSGKALPSTPQVSDRISLPDYVIAGGGAALSTVADGYFARIQSAEWMDRLIALFQALGNRYDGDPAVEQIIISETSMALADSTFTQDALVAQVRRLIPAVRAAWPTTPRVLMLNWLGSERVTADIVKLCADNGVGMGGPDILLPPPNGPYEDWGSQALRGAGGNFGSTDYRGRIPVSYSFEVPSYGGIQMKASELYRYAYDTLQTSHISWTMFDDKTVDQNWNTGVLPTIKARNGVVRSSCPSMFTQGCKTP
jgi:hypothetical protein